MVSTPLPLPVVLVIMGVSGSGKSTIATALSERLGWSFEEGDALHPAANVAKMVAGHPLTDDDRWPWLDRVADWIDDQLDAGDSGVITCSSLKRSYREVLNRRGSGVEFVYLAGTHVEIAARLAHREGHFMPPSLLDSQLETLEEPTADEPAIRVDVEPGTVQVVSNIIAELGLPTDTHSPTA